MLFTVTLVLASTAASAAAGLPIFYFRFAFKLTVVPCKIKAAVKKTISRLKNRIEQIIS